MKELMNINGNEVSMTSIEVVALINEFRKLEKNRKELRHCDFMSKIKKELEVLKSLDLEVERNISYYSYKAENGKTNPCYLLNKKGIMQMLNSESTLVRYKTQEYIEVLENKIREQQLQLTKKQELQLSILNGNDMERITSLKAYENLVIEEATKPLIETIEIQEPKVEYHDKVLNCDKLITTTIIAKDLGMSARALNKELHEKGIIYKSSGVWVLYAKYEHMIPKYCDYIINEYNQQLKWTELGRKFIIDLIKIND